jgi:hypothetical protein
LAEAGEPARTFAVIVRAYDDGVAFRYDLPKQAALENFVLTNERTEFTFAGDYRCWAGNESACAENHYGLLDNVATPAGISIMTGQLRGPVEKIPMPAANHKGDHATWNARGQEWLEAISSGPALSGERRWLRLKVK